MPIVRLKSLKSLEENLSANKVMKGMLTVLALTFLSIHAIVSAKSVHTLTDQNFDRLVNQGLG